MSVSTNRIHLVVVRQQHVGTANRSCAVRHTFENLANRELRKVVHKAKFLQNEHKATTSTEENYTIGANTFKIIKCRKRKTLTKCERQHK